MQFNGKIQIVWENEDFVNKHCTSKGCGYRGGCDGSKAKQLACMLYIVLASFAYTQDYVSQRNN